MTRIVDLITTVNVKPTITTTVGPITPPLHTSIPPEATLVTGIEQESVLLLTALQEQWFLVKTDTIPDTLIKVDRIHVIITNPGMSNNVGIRIGQMIITDSIIPAHPILPITGSMIREEILTAHIIAKAGNVLPKRVEAVSPVQSLA